MAETRTYVTLKPMTAGASGFARMELHAGGLTLQWQGKGLRCRAARCYLYAADGATRELGVCAVNAQGQASLRAELPSRDRLAVPIKPDAVFALTDEPAPRPLLLGLCGRESAGRLLDAKNAMLALCARLSADAQVADAQQAQRESHARQVRQAPQEQQEAQAPQAMQAPQEHRAAQERANDTPDETPISRSASFAAVCDTSVAVVDDSDASATIDDDSATLAAKVAGCHAADTAAASVAAVAIDETVADSARLAEKVVGSHAADTAAASVAAVAIDETVADSARLAEKVVGSHAADPSIAPTATVSKVAVPAASIADNAVPDTSIDPNDKHLKNQPNFASETVAHVRRTQLPSARIRRVRREPAPREAYLPAIDPSVYAPAITAHTETQFVALPERNASDVAALPAEAELIRRAARVTDTPVDLLRPLRWSKPFEDLSAHFAQFKPCMPFHLPGWRFVRVPMQRGYFLLGRLCRDGAVESVAYALPGAADAPPPNGLTGYRLLRGVDGQGYWICFQECREVRA